MKLFILLLLAFPLFYLAYYRLRSESKPNKLIKLPIPRNIRVLNSSKLIRQRLDKSLKPLYDKKAMTLKKIRLIDDTNKATQIIRFGRCKAKMTLAIVVCGDRRPMTLVAIKSTLALALSPIHFVIFTDDDNRQPLVEQLLDFPTSALHRLSFEIHSITFPESKMEEEWKKLFKLCAAQRLFLPSVLTDIDSLIYIDTDIVFLQPLDDLWKLFEKMNSSQMAALSPEHEDYATGWYNRFARHPYYKPLGVNSGVMLMNLTRMRKFQWQSYLEPIFHEYKLKIVWGDQDIINIIFHYHPDKLLIFGCEWNYRPDHCMYSRICHTADVQGISVLHGNRGVFVNGKQPSFRAVYMAFESYELGSDLEKHLFTPLKLSLKSTANTNCGSNAMAFYRKLQSSVLRLKSHTFVPCNNSVGFLFDPT